MTAKGLVHAAHFLNATFLQPTLCYVSHQPNAHVVFARGFQVVVGQLRGEAWIDGYEPGYPGTTKNCKSFFQNIPTQLREYAPEEEVCETFNEESLWLPLIRIPPKMNDIS